MNPDKLRLRNVERFLSKIRKDEDSGCWVWIGGIGVRGYGRFKMGGVTRFAHRVSYEMHKGQIDDGLFVLHSCDNRACVNPEHLSIGTQKDNQQDMKAKGRHCHGASSPNAKLTEENVLEMYRLHRSGIGTIRLSRQFGISKNLAWRIVNGLQWEHLYRSRHEG